jgi:hypothetical protein
VALGVGHMVLGTVRGRLQFELCKYNYWLWRKTQKHENSLLCTGFECPEFAGKSKNCY